MTKEKAIYTGSGMWILWDYEQYKGIDSYDDWEPVFLEDEDIEKQIEIAKAVPINIHSDGCFQFRIKVNEELDERESKYVCVKSEEYRLVTDGVIVLSGLENIYGNVTEDECIKVKVEKGGYSVTVYLIEWAAEPGMKKEDGSPMPDALPDFIVLIQDERTVGKEYRKAVDTFDEP